MNILKKTTLVLVASLLVTTLFSFGLFWSVHQVVSNPKNIKHALSQSGIYQTGIDNTLQQSLKAQSGGGGQGGDIPIKNAEVRAVISDAIPPAYLQTQIEQVLDAGYAWVQGKTPTLAFSIDLGSAKTKLADNMATYVTTRLSQLPVCAPAQVPVQGDVDYFNATCIPAGYAPATAGEKIKADILTGDFLKDQTITASTIKNNKGETLDQQLKHVPQAYSQAKKALYTLGVLAALLAVGVVFLSATKRAGLHKVGVTFITVGAISAFLGWAISYSTHVASTRLVEKGQLKEPLQQTGVEIAKLLTGDLRNWWMGYGITLVVLGIGALVALHLTKPAGDKKTEAFLREDDHEADNKDLLKGVAAPVDKNEVIKETTEKEPKEK
jgi:hypothetical protein